MWTTIDDNKVRNVWECPECNSKVYVQPWWYSYNGTPMCMECSDSGIDMEYVHTEIDIES